MGLRKINLLKVKAPIVLPTTEKIQYLNPIFTSNDEEVILYVDVKEQHVDNMEIYKAKCITQDLRRYSELEKVTEEEYKSVIAEKQKNDSLICSLRKTLGYFIKFVEKPEGICLKISADGMHWIDFTKDQPTYPENNIIYDGDYYKALPFGQYIHQDKIPEGKVFDIRDYGAVPDGCTLSTEAVKAAAEAARDAGGGTVLVTGGHYCIGSVNIYSHTTLFIDTDAALVASKDLKQYKDALVACVNQEDVAIKGGGKIIGNGEYFVYLPLKAPLLEPLPFTKLPPELYDPMGYPVDSIRYAYRARIRYAEDRYAEGKAKIKRPMYTVWIRGCKDVLIENIVIEDSFDWTLSIDFSQYIHIKDVVINGNRHVANTDGIDMMCSKHIDVEHCFISCADDGLCIKAPLKQGHDGINVEDEDIEMGPSYDIHINNCTVVTVMNAFKIGTETYYDISDVYVTNCKFMMPDIYPGSVSGISIESSDGSNVHNIEIDNIEMDHVCCPIFICQNMRNKFGFANPKDAEEKKYGGSIKDITIKNIVADHVEVPCILTGFATKIDDNLDLYGTESRKREPKYIEKKIENITISNYEAVYSDNKEVLDIRDQIHESVTDYPENNAFGDVPAYGFYIRHARNVVLKDYIIVPRTTNTRECVLCEDAVD